MPKLIYEIDRTTRSRLLTRILADDTVVEIVRSYFIIPDDIRQDPILGKIFLENKPEWVCWQTGLELRYLVRCYKTDQSLKIFFLSFLSFISYFHVLVSFFLSFFHIFNYQINLITFRYLQSFPFFPTPTFSSIASHFSFFVSHVLFPHISNLFNNFVSFITSFPSLLLDVFDSLL